jgi:hypothetical protein
LRAAGVHFLAQHLHLLTLNSVLALLSYVHRMLQDCSSWRSTCMCWH